MSPDVFISYKSEEYDYAVRVRSELQRNGISCWMAPESLPGGSSYAAEIPKAIRDCRAFVLILTDAAQNSKWVPRELDRAINADKRIFPFLPEKMEFNDDIIFYLTNVQYYAAFENWDAELEHLTADVCEFLGITPVPQPVPSAAETTAAETPEVSPVPKKSLPPTVIRRDKPIKKKRGKFRIPLIVGAVLLGLFIIVFVSSVVDFSPKVTIAGSTVSTKQSILSFENKKITQDDLKKLGEQQDARTISFTDCAFESDDISSILQSSVKHLILRRCSLTETQFSSLKLSESRLLELDISGNPEISRLGDLSGSMDSLLSLNISETGIRSFEGLPELKGLTEFRADQDEITDISFLKKYPSLKKLSLNQNKLKNLNVLDEHIYLEYLSASNNQLTDISGLKNTTLLQEVSLNNNQLTDISALKGNVEKFTRVYLSQNRLEDISILENAVNITYLDISQNALKNISSLYNMKLLEGVDASYNQISSIDSDRLAPTLHYLDAAHNQLTEITGAFRTISDKQIYLILNVEDNQLKTLSFTGKPSIGYLNIHQNPLDDMNFLYNISYWKCLVADYSDRIDYGKLKNVSRNYIIDCPLSKKVELEKIFGSQGIFLNTEQYVSSEYTPIAMVDALLNSYVIKRTKGISEG